MLKVIKSSFADPWQATNIQNLSFTGVETILRFRLLKSQELALGYTALRGSQEPQPGVISKYIFNYPSHNAVFIWLGQFHESLAVRTRVGAIQRESGMTPIPSGILPLRAHVVEYVHIFNCRI